MKNTGQIEAEIEEKIKQATTSQIVKKIKDVIAELYEARLAKLTGSLTKFEYNSPTLPQIQIEISSNRYDLRFTFNHIVVFAVHEPVQTNENSITHFISGDWEKFLAKGEILKLMQREKILAEEERLSKQRLRVEHEETQRKATPPSKELQTKAARFGVVLDQYDPAG